jgi:transcriptional regulator with XRE-family HTH domain
LIESWKLRVTALPEALGIATGSNYDAFGAVLRFWRMAFNLSQEVLAGRADISVRHLSFLENGRTRPSAAVIHRLAAGIGLKKREASVLYTAAGHTLFERNQDTDIVPGQIPEEWITILRHTDPLPGSIMDRFGRILAVNRAWVALHQLSIGRIAEGGELNALELFLHPQGWRRLIRNWSDAACVLLTIVQQEAMLVQNIAVLRAVKRWASTPGLPRDWPVIGAQLSRERSDYCFDLHVDREAHAGVGIVHAALGCFPADRNTYIIQTIYPERTGLRELLASASAIANGHALCAY